MTRHLKSATSMSLALGVVLLAACSHAPEASQDHPDIAGIGPRPHVFGRHAWDLEQAKAAQRAEAAQSSSASSVAAAPTPAPPAPSVEVASAAPVAPPAPVSVPQPPVAAPQPVAPPTPAPVLAPTPPPPPPAEPKPPVQTPELMAPPSPPPAPQVAMAPPPPAKPAKVKAPKPVPQPAQQADASQTPPHRGLLQILKSLPDKPPPPVVGGYNRPTDWAPVNAAAAFAVHESPGYVLKGIYQAKVQVVAGTNYSLCLWVRQESHESNPLHRRLVAAQVFQGLDQHYELVSWHEVDACEAGS